MDEMAVSKLSTPSLTKEKDYEQYKSEVELWQEVTEVNKEKQGVWLALALPDDHPDGLKEKVLGPSVGNAKLKGAEGVKNLLAYLDGLYKKDTFVDLYDAYRRVERYQRGRNDTIEKYIVEFNSLVVDAEKKGMTYPQIIKAFKLLEGSRTSEMEKQMIITNVKYEQGNQNLVKQMEASMKKVSGELSTLGRANNSKIDVKDVDTFVTENAQAFANAGYKKMRKRSFSDSDAQGKNPFKNGVRLKCFFCDSEDHMKGQCEKHRKYKEKLKKEKGDEWREDKRSDKNEKKEDRKDKKPLKLFSKNRGDGSDSESNFSMVLMAEVDVGCPALPGDNNNVCPTMLDDDACPTILDDDACPTMLKSKRHVEEGSLLQDNDNTLYRYNKKYMSASKYDSTPTLKSEKLFRYQNCERKEEEPEDLCSQEEPLDEFCATLPDEGSTLRLFEDDQGKAGESEVCILSAAEKEALVFLAEDCEGRAVLDTACTNDVCGEKWYKQYIASLNKKQLSNLEKSKGWRTFKFGGGERLTSKAEVILPAFIGDQEVLLRVDVVASEIPLLLSLDTLKRAETILDMKEDIALMTGMLVDLKRSRSGHYTISLDKGEKESVLTLIHI